MKYQRLFSRGKIGSLELRNRIVMPPMGTNMASFTGEATDEIIRYYEERAKGGCGLIITEITRIDEGPGIGMLGQLSVTSPKFIRSLIKLADAVHKYDSKVFLQLHHPGRATTSYITGTQPVAPSPIPDKVVGEMPRELTTKECEDLINKFIFGARVAKVAGFDGIELHGAHGYLICQFLSPYSNKRTDKYGGDEEGRFNFLKEIVIGIGEACGKDFPISVRLSADELVQGGLTLADTVKIAQKLEKIGVSTINVSAGVYETGYATIEPQGFPEGWKKHLATEIKKNVNIPVVAVNNIKNPATAEKFLEEGVCDFVAIGRGHIADPEWGNKAKAGKDAEIRKCIGCMHCFRSLELSRPIECTVNPLVGRELIFNEDTLKKNGNGRTVAVVGGGPAGMHAAAVLAKRGYKVTIFEKNDRLGGTMLLGEKPPRKENIRTLIETQALEVANAGVEVRLNSEATVEKIKAQNPYGVVVAAGGIPIVPNLPGIDKPNVYFAEQVLDESVKISDKIVVVIGGGVTGLETAELLAKDNKSVTVVEMLKDVGTALYATVRVMLLRSLRTAGVNIMTNKKLNEIKDAGVVITDTVSKEVSELDADAVVLAMGIKKNSELEKFKDAFENIIYVGDANKPGLIADAMRDANDKAYVF